MAVDKMTALRTYGRTNKVDSQLNITMLGEVNMEQFSFDAAKEFLKDSKIGDDDDALKVRSVKI